MSVYWKYVVSACAAIILGFNIFFRVDLPPYGIPLNELSDNYWGVITDIAHRWRSPDLGFWTREMAGGASLFNSGEYPILNPTNALAWILNDAQFFLVKLIEPYVLGFFFMMVLLWDVFKARWYVACFGGLAYMGLSISKATTIAESPYFLLGCGLFPAMILVAIKLAKKHVYLAAMGVGALVAFQFLAEGVTQLPQLTIWWLILWTIYFMAQPWNWHTTKQWGITLALFMMATIGVGAIQLFPTMQFFHYESSRLSGYYSLNNFKLFSDTLIGQSDLAQVVFGGLINAGPLRSKTMLILMLICLGLACLHVGRIFSHLKNKRFVYLFWIATAIYFLLPSMADTLARFFPFLHEPLSFLTLFNFRYALHILDFCIVLSVCLMIDNESLVVSWKAKSWVKRILSIGLLTAALAVLFLPVALLLFPQLSAMPLVDAAKPYFTPSNIKQGWTFVIKSLLLFVLIVFRPWGWLRSIALIVLLIGSGYMMMLDCFKWYDKGCRNHPELYQLDSPEHLYYAKAQGKYMLPYISQTPAWAVHNYNLLHGVHGTCGFMALAPLRLNTFEFYFNNRFQQSIDPASFVGNPKFMNLNGPAPSGLTTYFPVDFTLVAKEQPFKWEGFHQVVKGDSFDVYERIAPTPLVYFADKLEIMPMADVIRQFDRPRTTTLFVTDQDAQSFVLSTTTLAPSASQAMYQQFKRIKDNHLSFDVITPDDVFVIVPERYDHGWSIRVDGKEVKKFPAHYLFLGFQVSAGEHHVEMIYTPGWFWLGLILNILTLGMMYGVARKFLVLKA